MKAAVRAGLAKSLDPQLVNELLEAYEEAKRNYFLGGNRLTAVEGGRFCEAAFRLLQQRTTNTFTPIGKQLDSEKLINQLANIAPATQPDSVRLHIPRALRVVYDIRNKRDAAHLADGIDPNVQDATLVVSVLDWVLAEFVRLYHSVSPADAQRMVEDVVTRQAPVVQEFAGFLKVCKPGLGVSDLALVLLYHRGAEGATFEELKTWVKPSMRANLRRTLLRLADERDLVHGDAARYFITRLGQQFVEANALLRPA